MTIVDWVALGLIALLAIAGAARGLVAGMLSVVGIVCGALLGAKLGPLVLPDGEQSPYVPIAALFGAILLAALFEAVGSVAGTALRAQLRFRPLRTLDSIGGLVLGGATAVAIVWVLGAVALQVPGQTELRREAQRSAILRQLNHVVPPRDLLNALARVDPFPRLAGPLADVERPDPRVIREPAVRGAASSVVNVVGTACGLGVVGSGWVARPNLVVTAAHVVAGQSSPTVRAPGGSVVDAVPVAFDSRNDIAVLRVPPGSLGTTPLQLVDPQEGAEVAIVGYPENQGLTAAPARVGQTTKFLSRDAYGNGPVFRLVTTLRGRIRPGNSGGPAVDNLGRVQATVFAARIGSDSGYGVPASLVRDALGSATRPVSTGPCVR